MPSGQPTTHHIWWHIVWRSSGLVLLLPHMYSPKLTLSETEAHPTPSELGQCNGYEDVFQFVKRIESLFEKVE